MYETSYYHQPRSVRVESVSYRCALRDYRIARDIYRNGIRQQYEYTTIYNRMQSATIVL